MDATTEQFFQPLKWSWIFGLAGLNDRPSLLATIRTKPDRTVAVDKSSSPSEAFTPFDWVDTLRHVGPPD